MCISCILPGQLVIGRLGGGVRALRASVLPLELLAVRSLLPCRFRCWHRCPPIGAWALGRWCLLGTRHQVHDRCTVHDTRTVGLATGGGACCARVCCCCLSASINCMTYAAKGGQCTPVREKPSIMRTPCCATSIFCSPASAAGAAASVLIATGATALDASHGTAILGCWGARSSGSAAPLPSSACYIHVYNTTHVQKHNTCRRKLVYGGMNTRD